MKQAWLGMDEGVLASMQTRSPLGGIHIGDEFSGFGVGVMQIPLAKFCNAVVSPRLVGERAINQSMLRKWPAYSP